MAFSAPSHKFPPRQENRLIATNVLIVVALGQLARMQKTGVDASFVYNENGLRVQKTVNGVVTDYTLHGKNIVHMTQGNDELHFFYDAQSKPAVVVYNGVAYTYAKNLQGDIIAILDDTGAIVVTYVYDAWGRPIGKTGSMASSLGTVQPFRYRGYIYDDETGLYYLRSRYYNSCWCRFTNADQIIGNVALITHNLYAYCKNCANILVDPNGTDPQGEHTSIPFSDALNVLVNETSMEIQCYVNVSGDIDPNFVEQGIEKYWNRDDLIVNGAPFSLSCDIIQGESPNGYAINIYTFNSEKDKGITNAFCTLDGVAWASGYISVNLRRYYADGRKKEDELLQWSVAHEFAHVLGISDYYLEHPGTEFPSITNKPGTPVSADDIQMVMEATKQQAWTVWP